MSMNEKRLGEILSALDAAERGEHSYFGKKKGKTPSRKEVVSIIKGMQALMFPDYFKVGGDESTADGTLREVYNKLKEQISLSIKFSQSGCNESEAALLADEIIGTLPKIKAALIKDIEAIYEGDPAASSPEEVILSYPGFYAISIYRIAHELYIRSIPCIARLMTEFAHEKTGIDIHAGATVGEYFFIDHGTGIVIGETTTIGDHVKIYQGVTLGAKSFELDENGNPIKGIKRHPDIGNNCVIYANATILGGNTKIGDGAVIGGNVWLTHSVAPGEVVYYDAK